MYHITENDKKEILNILLNYKCKCKMSELIKGYGYLNDKKSKRDKIRKIIRKLNEELNKTINLQIIEDKAYVEIIF